MNHCLFILPVILCLATAPTVTGAEASDVSADTVALDAAIRHTLADPQFTWRLPRTETETSTDSTVWLVAFFRDIGKAFEQLWHWIEPTLQRWSDWLEALFKNTDQPPPRDPGNWELSIQTLWFIVIALVASGLALLAWRFRRRMAATPTESIPLVEPLPAITEQTQADERPEDAWLILTHTLARQGEYRLAVRTLLLACLARLASSGLIRLARHKSNHDYLRELQRHQAGHPDLPPLFTAITVPVERIWYGTHPVDAGILAQIEQQEQHLAQSTSGPVNQGSDPL
ncbi:MAG: hypothetical protein A2498_04730 [Lentisphaerae bacterium RIFOXYC12_FULL_60_16]|nr:MAG: hypothetical protein A2498_04730 [Lentisphaerae bacterium RIFOXYC12_FULL_60_16]